MHLGAESLQGVETDGNDRAILFIDVRVDG